MRKIFIVWMHATLRLHRLVFRSRCNKHPLMLIGDGKFARQDAASSIKQPAGSKTAHKSNKRQKDT